MFDFKCKRCGGELDVDLDHKIAKCKYCGTKQSLPKFDSDKQKNMYDLAGSHFSNGDFDKAFVLYEELLKEDSSDSDLYWSLVLCTYGIEYVEDHKSNAKIPTVNRVQYTSIFDNEYYKLAIKYASDEQREIYEEEASKINIIQKEYLRISQREEPFDVFICYKETDERGRRTLDSVIANDLYNELVRNGFKVFFARITLEDKLGVAYEPYIFAALNSSKVMVVIGTSKDNLESVWVKNEWSRFLGLMKDNHEKVLIPAYKDMDPYDLPSEFSHLQAQDMSKLGFMQDLVRGINKILGYKDVQVNNGSVNGMVERAKILIEDSDFAKATEVLESALNINPKVADIYVCKLLIEYKLKSISELGKLNCDFTKSSNYNKILRFGSEDLINKLEEYHKQCLENIKVNGVKPVVETKVSPKKEVSTPKKKNMVIPVALSIFAAAGIGVGIALASGGEDKPKEEVVTPEVEVKPSQEITANDVYSKIASGEINLSDLNKYYSNGLIYDLANIYINNGDNDSAITCLNFIPDYSNAYELMNSLTGESNGESDSVYDHVYYQNYPLHYSTLNYLVSNSNNDSQIYSNMVEGLVEFDYANRIVPVGCLSYDTKTLDNGKQVWTFKLNPEVKWYEPAYNMKEYGKVTAKDYVEAIRYILNPINNSQSAAFVANYIDGAEDYMNAMLNGMKPDFFEVGVKALDTYTLEYTLPRPMNDFLTALTNGCFSPANGDYIKSQGINFGTSKDTILVNGPYYITEDGINDKIVMKANEYYWNKDLLEVDEIQFNFIDPLGGLNSDRLLYEDGKLSSFMLSEGDLDGWTNHVYGPDNSGNQDHPYDSSVVKVKNVSNSSFGYVFNVGRYYHNHYDTYSRTNQLDEASKLNTSKALANDNFRKAILWGLDVTQFNQRSNYLDIDERTRNVYTPANFAYDQFGKDYIEYYYEEFAKQNNMALVEVRELLQDGNDYYENDYHALQLFKQAVQELEGEVTFPVTIDFLCSFDEDTFLYQNAMLNDINNKFGKYVDFKPVDFASIEEFQNLVSYSNYDMYGLTGWQPDFEDPLTFAETFDLNTGYMLDAVGLEQYGSQDSAYEDLRQRLLGEYTRMVEDAKSYTDQSELNIRFKKFSEAEYHLLNEVALYIPAYSNSSESLYLTKVVPNTILSESVGDSVNKLKYVRVHKNTITKEEMDTYLEQYNNGQFDELYYANNKAKDFQ